MIVLELIAFWFGGIEKPGYSDGVYGHETWSVVVAWV